MSLCRSGDEPLSEPIMVNVLTHMCVTRPQWVKSHKFAHLFNYTHYSYLLLGYYQYVLFLYTTRGCHEVACITFRCDILPRWCFVRWKNFCDCISELSWTRGPHVKPPLVDELFLVNIFKTNRFAHCQLKAESCHDWLTTYIFRNFWQSTLKSNDKFELVISLGVHRVSDVTLEDMGKIDRYQVTTKQKAQITYIILRMYSISLGFEFHVKNHHSDEIR